MFNLADLLKTFPQSFTGVFTKNSLLNKVKPVSTCFRSDPDWIRTNDPPGLRSGCSIQLS